MDLATPLPFLFAILSLGGIGLYLAMPHGTDVLTRGWRRAGAILGGLSLVLLAAWITAPADMWRGSRLDSWAWAVLFYALAGCAIVSAAAVILSRTPRRSAACFVAAVLGVSGLHLLLGSVLLVIVTVMALGLATAGSYRLLFAPRRFQPMEKSGAGDAEPLLACLAAALLAAGLLGVIRYACTVEARPTNRGAATERGFGAVASALPRWPRREGVIRDYRLLNLSLSTAAVVFVLGGIGLVTRPEALVTALSAGLMLLGVLLTLAAFGHFHVERSATAFALLALATVSVHSALWIALPGPRSAGTPGQEAEAVRRGSMSAVITSSGGGHG